MQNRVAIYMGDTDGIPIAGTWINQIDTNARTVGFIKNSPIANGDEIKYRRFFSKGGLYKVRFIGIQLASGALIDIGLDANGASDVFSQVDSYNAVTTYNVIKETVKEISRGYHEIHIKANGKNGSSTNYACDIIALEFELTQEYPVYQDDRLPQINQGSKVLLGKHVAVIAESTFTFNFADVDLLNKYSEIEIEIVGSATASLALQMLLNAIASGYYQQGFTSIGASLTNVNISAASNFQILGTNIITGAFQFAAKVSIALPLSNGNVDIKSRGSVAGVGANDVQGGISTSSFGSKLLSILLQTSTSTWIAGTTFSVYGVRK